MSKLEKQIISFLVALIIPWVIAIVVGLIFDRELMLAIGLLLSFYTVLGGFNNNGEFAQSIGVFLGNVTDWIIPQGFSWWLPPPFGKSFNQTRVVGRELDRTLKGGDPIQGVITKDGSQSGISLLGIYDITDLLKWVSISEPEINLSKHVAQAVRDFGLAFHATGEGGLTSQKDTLRDHLLEEAVQKKIQESCGVTMRTYAIDHVIPPASLVQAAEEKEREALEAERELLDTKAVAEQMDILIAKGVGAEEALNQVQASRNIVRAIRVSGNAGDFTKGAAVAEPKDTSKHKGDDHGH